MSAAPPASDASRRSLCISLSFSPHIFLPLARAPSPFLPLSHFALYLPISISMFISVNPAVSLSLCLYFSISLSTPQEVEEKAPCLFLLALDAHELKVVTSRGAGVPAAVGGGGGRGGSSGAAAPRLWLLIAWIPDDAKVSARSFKRSG